MRKSVSIDSRLASGKCLKLSQEGDDVFQSREVWAGGLRAVLVVFDGVWYPGALHLTVLMVVLEGT